MLDEIFNVMKYFPDSYINQHGELILSEKGNVYFTATNCKTKEDIICKLLEWCSRPIAKGFPYSTTKRNKEWRNSLLCGYNNYLGTNFTQEDMYWIYDKTIQNWRCSVCNETPKTLGYVGTSDFMEKEFAFCNHCGSEMVGVENG